MTSITERLVELVNDYKRNKETTLTKADLIYFCHTHCYSQAISCIITNSYFQMYELEERYLSHQFQLTPEHYKIEFERILFVEILKACRDLGKYYREYTKEQFIKDSPESRAEVN